MPDNSGLFEEMQALIIAQIKQLELPGHWRTMYGGLVFELEAKTPKTLIGGIFASKLHLKVDFSHGHLLDDPTKILEGEGKYRRHIKLRSLNDIEDKNVMQFFARAHQMQTAGKA
ncbi:MAG: DUF1801 domain-containing protein [Rhizobiales bacterium]|nr:DUF1801 domain-containing protein [Hyphomicrobiales bacterium]NRB13304.1 DUF1801 domain-containing protein [Hyphomicrobiales bacterium]